MYYKMNFVEYFEKSIELYEKLTKSQLITSIVKESHKYKLHIPLDINFQISDEIKYSQ